MTRVRLMHNDTIRKADGETVERLVAIDVEIWGKRGTAFAEHVTTRTPVFIEGRMQLDQWQAEYGSPRSRLLVRVDDWQSLFYNSGERVQEIVDLKIESVRWDAPLTTLRGKGNKERVLPLWPETIQALEDYLKKREFQGCSKSTCSSTHEAKR